MKARLFTGLFFLVAGAGVTNASDGEWLIVDGDLIDVMPYVGIGEPLLVKGDLKIESVVQHNGKARITPLGYPDSYTQHLSLPSNLKVEGNLTIGAGCSLVVGGSIEVGGDLKMSGAGSAADGMPQATLTCQGDVDIAGAATLGRGVEIKANRFSVARNFETDMTRIEVGDSVELPAVARLCRSELFAGKNLYIFGENVRLEICEGSVVEIEKDMEVECSADIFFFPEQKTSVTIDGTLKVITERLGRNDMAMIGREVSVPNDWRINRYEFYVRNEGGEAVLVRSSDTDGSGE